jgi:membrane protein
MTIGGIAVGSLLKKVGRNILATDVLGLSAQTAYYFFFSLFPLFLFAAPLLSLLGDKRTTVDLIMAQMADALPSDAYRLIAGVVNDVVFAKDAPGVISLGALLTLWAGSNVFSALTDALNRAFGVTDTRSWWKKTLIACGFVIGASIVGLIATVVLLDGENVVRRVADFVGLGTTTKVVWTIIQFPLAIVFIVLLAWAIYFVLPNLRMTWGEALLGALLATLLWIVVTLAFRLYVQHFGNYNRMYGTIGAVVVLLIWMYLTMLAILSAGVVAAEVHGELSGRRTPGDTGRGKPRGRKADTARDLGVHAAPRAARGTD